MRELPDGRIVLHRPERCDGEWKKDHPAMDTRSNKQHNKEDHSRKRVGFSSTFGVVFATAGVAIGLGNIWRFPYMMGRDGGVVFLILYLLIMVLFGAPMLMCEWALGRRTKRGPWGAMEKVGMPFGRFWSILLLVTVVMAASYYGVVVAWVFQEGVEHLSAALRGAEVRTISELTATLPGQAMFLVQQEVAQCR